MSPNVRGMYTAKGAFEKLLPGSNLRYGLVNERTASILAAEAQRERGA
jgi:hypothetical protein